MVTRKRGRQEMEADDTPAVAPAEPSTLYKLRNMWEFASLMQYIFFFGRAVKIDEDFDIEVQPRKVACTADGRPIVLMMDTGP